MEAKIINGDFIKERIFKEVKDEVEKIVSGKVLIIFIIN